MIHFSKTIKFSVVSGLISLAFVAGYYALNNQIKEKNREAAAILNEIDSALLVGQQLRSVQKLIRDTEVDRIKLDGYFVSNEGIVDFLEVIEGLEQYTGVAVSIKSIGENDTGEFEGFERLELKLTTEGSWEAVYHFFTLLESLPYSINMERVQFDSVVLNVDEEDAVDMWRGVFAFSAVKIK